MTWAISVGKSATYAATCNGVYRSDDAGGSWHEAGLQGECVIRLAADPDSETVYATAHDRNWVSVYPDPSFLVGPLYTDSTTWVSRDGARSWSQMPLFSANSIAVDPTEPGTAYAASYSSEHYPLAVTRDYGATWTRVAEAPPLTFLQVVVDPRDGLIYAAGVGSTGVVAIGDGRVWTETQLSLAAIGIGTGSDGAVYAAKYQGFCRRTAAVPIWACGPQAWTAPLDVVEIPATATEGPTILVVDFDGVWASTDGGRSWTLAADGPVGYTPALALDRASSVVYAGNDVGISRSVDRGRTWTSSSSGLRSSWVRALAADPADASTIWAGTQGRGWGLDQPVPGLYRSTNAGDSWTRTSEAGKPGDVFTLDVSAADPRRVYAASPFELSRSDDGGTSWSTSKPFGFYGIAADPASPTTVWAATDVGLKKSVDGGSTWSDALAGAVYSILFDSRRPGTIYAGSSLYEPSFYYPFGWGFAVHTSHDDGATWSRVGGESEGGILALATDPFSQDIVYAGTNAGTILRSPDAGASWERWSRHQPSIFVLTLVADPVRSGTLYQGGWRGVFRSVDGGRRWEDFSDGLAPFGVFGLVVSRDGRYLYAGTNGGGVYRHNLLIEDRQPVMPIDRPRTTRTVPP